MREFLIILQRKKRFGVRERKAIRKPIEAFIKLTVERPRVDMVQVK